MRCRARSSRLRQAGTTSTKRNSAAFSSASFDASSIAFSSAAFSGLREVRGSAAASFSPTANSSCSSALSSTTRLTIPWLHEDRGRRARRVPAGRGLHRAKVEHLADIRASAARTSHGGRAGRRAAEGPIAAQVLAALSHTGIATTLAGRGGGSNPSRSMPAVDVYSCAAASEAHGPARPVVLDDRALLEQQVDVAEHLAQRQVGLGDRDVAPQRLRDLVRRARPLGDQPADLARAPLVQREALVDQLDVVGDRVAVAGEDELERPSRASRASSACR